ncbi:MAG TPA: ATP-binding protein [Longimicrobium sp.]|nr:ATP-binding protein [Longimicrobium sp.]
MSADANQRALVAELARLRALLERHAARGGESPAEAPPPVESQSVESESPGGPVALDVVCAAFGLSPFERGVLLLAAGVELDGAFPALCAAAHGDERRAYATFGLALAILPEAHWSALAPDAPLRFWRLVEPAPGDALSSAPLRIDERILHHLAGVPSLDERLRPLAEPLAPPDDLLPSRRDAAERVLRSWRNPAGGSAPLVVLTRADGAGAAPVAAAACGALGLTAYALRAADLPAAAAEREALARLWDRETVLAGAAVVIEIDDTDPPETARAAVAFADRLRGPAVIAAADAPPAGRRPAVRVEAPLPTAAEQRALWEHALGEGAARLNGELDAVVAQFRLEPAAIHAAATAFAPADGDAGRALWEICRTQSRPRLDDLAQRISSPATWDDLVLPEAQRGVLREIAAHVRHRPTVYDAWGFRERGPRGLGITALFAGPSGTGKTMAAEVLANELRLDLYRIDLSAVTSKYIGETEKNLRRVFNAAEGSGAMLLFDEADALFGKRSEVKDSRDRYANQEVSYLLQRMEAYRGLAVLTTNLKDSLDTAFLRRIRFVVHFPFPDAEHRERIWRRAFPAAVPTEALEPEKLARLNVAGGNIRNIALGAAFLAAGEGAPVRMAHLLRAARGEYAKLEKPLVDSETRGWA